MRAFSTQILCVALALLRSATSIPLTERKTESVFDRKDNIAVYWGQNSYGKSSGPLAQQRLVDYCANSSLDIIPMAFLIEFTKGESGLQLNFANQENDCSLFPGTQLASCPTIAADIKTCQQVYGKTILLSIGGGTYSGFGFESAAQAEEAGRLLVNTFGPVPRGAVPAALNSTMNGTLNHPGSGNWTFNSRIKPRQVEARKSVHVLRPFGDAVIDGFDFDFETPIQFYLPFAQTLRTLMDSDQSKKFYLTAAPQCVFPDQNNDVLLSSDVFVDAIFVQFYNNPCGVQTFTPGSRKQYDFNFGVWNHWAASKGTKVFLGVPAGPSAAGSGYLDSTELEPIIQYSRKFPTFGGVMMWDASQAWANKGFLQGVRDDLDATASRRMI